MKHLISLSTLIVFMLIPLGAVWAQQGIGTNTPNSSAVLDIESPDKGVLFPRLRLTASDSFSPIAGTPSITHNGLLVYNTNTATTTR